MDELEIMHSISERMFHAPEDFQQEPEDNQALYAQRRARLNSGALERGSQVTGTGGDPDRETSPLRFEPPPSEPSNEITSEPSNEIIEESLYDDKEFVKASTQVFELYEGRRFDGTAEEAVDYGLEVMGEFAFNFFGIPGVQPFSTQEEFSGGGMLAQAATIINSGEPENAQAFLYLLSQYERLPTFSFPGTARMFRGLMNDPTTIAGAFSGGLPLVLKQLGLKKAAGSVRKVLKAVAENSFKAGAGAGAVYAGGGEAAQIGVERAAGEEVSDLEAALRTGISSVAGAGVGGTAAKVVEKVAPVVGEFIMDAGDAARARMEENKGSTQLMSGVNPDGIIAMAGDAVRELTGEAEPDLSAKLISQRLPTAKTAKEDPIATPLVTNTEVTLKQKPEKIKENFQKVSLYPNMPANLSELEPNEAAQVLKNHVVDNLLFLHDAVPDNIRQRSKLWYEGANKISQDLADKYGLPLESVAGVMASLSPQKDWYQNADLGRRVIEIMHNVTKGNEKAMVMTPEMRDTMSRLFKESKPTDKVIMDAITGKTFDELELPAEKAMWLRAYDETYNDRSYSIVNPEGTFGDVAKTVKGANAKVAWGSLGEIGKAIASIQSNGDLKTISDAMGSQNKVRNFYNNIYNPGSENGDVTIDTHAIAAAYLRPLAGDATEVHHNFGSSPDKKKRDEFWQGSVSNSSITGTKGLYGIYADAYREAASQRGILPREMQSITWEAVRGLFTDVFKRDKEAVADINEIWRSYKQGKITAEEARNAAVKRAGGIDNPTWQD